MQRILAPLFAKSNSAARCGKISAAYDSRMEKSKRSKIEPVHVEEAARLKAIYEVKNAGPGKLSQLEFGQKYEIGTQGMVWQYLNAKAALNTDAALKFAAALQCNVSDFSPRLAAPLDAAQSGPAAEESHGMPERITPRRALEIELRAVLDRMSDSGLRLLIDLAEQIAKRDPRAQANRAA